jgi:hypothetical protein
MGLPERSVTDTGIVVSMTSIRIVSCPDRGRVSRAASVRVVAERAGIEAAASAMRNNRLRVLSYMPLISIQPRGEGKRKRRALRAF